MNKKLEQNATISVLLKNVLLLPPIKEKYPNNYKEKRCQFVVCGLKIILISGKKGNDTVVVLKL